MPNKPIASILISGGTHGNEMSGIKAVTQWQQNSAYIESLCPSAKLHFELTNQPAIVSKVRYLDEDLNRQFIPETLSSEITEDLPSELKLALALNEQYGPKGQAKTDFIIDIHNTTSNMGPTLIVLDNDDFNQNLARFVKNAMPEAVILVEDQKPFAANGYLCTISPRGVMIEVGPQPQNVLKAKAYQQTIKMAELIVEFVQKYNTQNIVDLPPVPAFRLGKEISYPTDEHGNKTAMIHPNVDNNDFRLLKNSQACFVDFSNQTISWDEPDTYPHFVSEAAYDHLNIAFATSSKCMF